MIISTGPALDCLNAGYPTCHPKAGMASGNFHWDHDASPGQPEAGRLSFPYLWISFIMTAESRVVVNENDLTDATLESL